MDIPFRFVVIHVDADGRFAFGGLVGSMGLEEGCLPLQGFRRGSACVFGEENALGVYFARVHFHRFIRQLKIYLREVPLRNPGRKNFPGTPGPGMSRDTGAERISSEVELVSVEQKEENIQCKKRESGSSASLFHSVRVRRFRHFSSWQPDEAVLW